MTTDKTVVVTGATGLLGRQVLDAYKSAGWKVTGTGWSRANPPSILKVDLAEEAELKTLLNDVK